MKIWTKQEEADALSARFAQVKNRKKFAREKGITGGDTLIFQHMNAIRPISMKAAIEYAKAFDCALEEISPRIALEIARASHVAQPSQDPDAAPPDPRQSPDYQTLEKSPIANVENPQKEGDNMHSLDGISDEMRVIIQELARIDRTQGRRRGVLIATIGAIIATTESD
ncbi:hypothetical protein [Burkholderia lata]|uniref:hypothetical protein n=1 Tax=Burkholderia lata (strain ATCC 17760 / DSM 23089 / LMG 22485 / NCIMB 9086 / R18194 / 383) TaxID=482957 RepID=UPI0015831315|nr:hypothetical protein [Burkholderia lata]